MWMGLEALAGSVSPPLKVLWQVLMLLSWSLIGTTAYHSVRRNLIPATWLLASIVGCGWALIIIQRIG